MNLMIMGNECSEDDDFCGYQVRHKPKDCKTLNYIGEPESFDYALYQHQLVTLNHPKRGEAFYLYKGIQASKSMAYQIIETDYMSLFGFVRGVY